MNSLLLYLKKYTGTLLCLLQLATNDCAAQLRINDTLGDVYFSSVNNTQKHLMKLSDFKDKALIIDFWDTGCHSCLESFPIIDSLQKKFKNELQIILVTKQDRKTIEDFFSRFKKIKIPPVPIVTNDVTLSSLFPSEGYPYIVWIDRDRRVKYFTGAYNMTSDHFEKFLKAMSLNVKNVAKEKLHTPLWRLDDSAFFKNVKCFSSLTSCIYDLDTNIPNDNLLNDGSFVQLSCNCSTLLGLIKKAFGEDGKYPVNTKYGLEIHVDSNLLFRPKDMDGWDEWDNDHLFNYTLILRASNKDALYKTMQDDLQRYFDISVVTEKKKVEGYELVKLNNQTIPISKSKNSFDAYNNSNVEDTDTLRFTNQPFERLMSLLNFWIHNSFPFTSSLKEGKKIDFWIRKSSIELLNIEELNQDLKKLNLKLRATEIETDVVIIKTKSKGCTKQPLF